MIDEKIEDIRNVCVVFSADLKWSTESIFLRKTLKVLFSLERLDLAYSFEIVDFVLNEDHRNRFAIF